MHKYAYLETEGSSLSLEENLKNSLALSQELLEAPITPSWDKLMEKWKNISDSFSLFFPRSFVIIHDIKTHKAVFVRGLSALGYQDDYLITARDITHENQRAIMAYQSSMVHKVFLREPGLIKERGMTYCNTRSLKDKSGVYWLVSQIVTPAQYDRNGRMARYLVSYRLLREYNGEPYLTNIYTHPECATAQKELRRRLEVIRLGMLRGLGFTRRQQEVIEYMGEDFSKATILGTMGINETGLKKHREKILAIGRQLFPINNFKTASDVIDYLKRQGII